MRNVTEPRSAQPRVAVVAASGLADLVAVAVFVAVGRSSHHEPLSLGGLLTTGWPFAVGVAAGYVGVALTRWPPLSPASGVLVAVKTLIIGMVLRGGVQRAGTPLSFVLVTAVVLGLLMVGWRLVARNRIRRVRADQPRTEAQLDRPRLPDRQNRSR